MSTTGDATGYETDLDASSPDAITANEAEGLCHWYAETHGEGNNDLTRFVPFLIEHCPSAFKRYRRNSEVVRSTAERLPLHAVGLCFLHSYIVLGRERESFYEVIAAREWGATKQEVLDTIQLAFLEAGPVGMNAVAALSERYLRDWPETEERKGEGWPPSWQTPPAGAGAGAEPPAYVQFLAKHRPDALETLRHRFEHARRDWRLPPQMIPILRLHTATIRRQSETIQEVALEARRLGVVKTQLLEALLFAFIYADEETMNVATRALDPVLETWQ